MSKLPSHNVAGKQLQPLNRALRTFQQKPPPPKPLPPHPRRKAPWIIGGLALYAFTTYTAYTYTSLTHLTTSTPSPPIPEDVSDRYNHTAATFDSSVNFTEKITGINWLRRRLTRQARGDILEVSVGTGRNARFYKLGQCDSLTFVDQSASMVATAQAKFKALHPSYHPSTFHTQSALLPLPSPPPHGYTTILQTMGLCSTPHPSHLLAHLGTLASPTNGRILLLEHGRSHYEWLNRILDASAPAHADRHGCWWNRDVGRIVEESGLEVVGLWRYHFGTLWWVELRPRR